MALEHRGYEIQQGLKRGGSVDMLARYSTIVIPTGAALRGGVEGPGFFANCINCCGQFQCSKLKSEEGSQQSQTGFIDGCISNVLELELIQSIPSYDADGINSSSSVHDR